MKTRIVIVFACILSLLLLVGCYGQGSSADAGDATGDSADLAGSWKFTVDIDNATLDISTPFGTNAMTTVDGHTLEVINGPAGCTWDDGAGTFSCEILFRNLDSDECMHNVRTRLNHSTNPSVVTTGADYTWPGPTIVPDSVQPINESGYCITEPSPSSAGPVEGCSGTWQESIPSGGIATQAFNFTNVPTGTYIFWVQIFATYQACPPPPGMALIPAGCFEMGDAFDPEGGANELPVHNVCITSGFYMDIHEVTNAEYAACVTGSGCTPPFDDYSATRDPYYGNATYDNYPVILVDWDQATAYCSWASKRLPSEAEWEYAARGGLAGKRYPWGNTLSGAMANYWNSGDAWDNDTSPVGSFPANGYGLYDMSGNVFEWVNDDYSFDYYSVSPVDDPPGHIGGDFRILRGGDWGYAQTALRVTYRYYGSYWAEGNNLGFRCVAELGD